MGTGRRLRTVQLGGSGVNEMQLEQMARDAYGLEPSEPLRVIAAGNINRSAVVRTGAGDFVLQELNHTVFPDPAALMANAMSITDQMRAHNLPALEFLPSRTGELLSAIDGVPWRCYRYVDGTTLPALKTPEDAQATARAYGRYAAAIDSLTLAEHLPGYHDFDGRVAELERAIDADEAGRVGSSVAVVEAVLNTIDRVRLAPSYAAWSDMPTRNVHNDAKGPNCVRAANGARTIIDLDTTMPGLLLADVGELVRSSTRALAEQPLTVIMSQIEAVNRGFLAGYRNSLTEAEQAGMLLAGPLLTTENAVRFLADHLSGDKYYGANEPDQNLHRAGEQQRLATIQIEAIEQALSA